MVLLLTVYFKISVPSFISQKPCEIPHWQNFHFLPMFHQKIGCFEVRPCLWRHCDVIRKIFVLWYVWNIETHSYTILPISLAKPCYRKKKWKNKTLIRWFLGCNIHSKTPHVVTVLWLDSDDVVTILSSTRNLVEGYKTVYLCHLDSYTVTVCNGDLVSSYAVAY